ncbi:hypothetical protein DdX_17448 [Ditylenchus destructor]|uniref:Uncharacterized protein n=1 Tax=Ditylenchus destructor TaxID=166010 RepID=A0AAD4MN02_9BILA|nr:hypothetical protein DdX_17448 [Ditylenchus destructor]
MATDYKLTLAPIAVGTEKQEIHQNQIICSMKEKWLIYRDNIFFLKHPITGITQKSFLLEIPEPPKKAEADKENNGNKVHLQLRNQRAIGNEVCFESICTMLGVLPCEMRNQRTCEMRCRETQETECKSFKNWLGVLGRESVLFSGPLRKLTIAEDGTQCKARHKCVDGSCVIKQDWELFIEGAVVFINDPSNWYPGNWKENIDKQQ